MASVDVTRIASNIGALNALNSLQNINKSLATHQTRLSTGKRINSAADDPAGLTIATKMLARSEGLKTAGSNISDAKNMLSVAEGGLSKLTDILIQMRSKAEQAASDTLGSSERQAIQTQLSAYAQQIDSIVNETKWNGVKLLDGTVNKQFQTGVDAGEVTTWALNTKHDPTTLNVSQKVTADQATLVSNTGTSFTGQASVAAFNGLTKLSTGQYTVEVLDKSSSATVGKVNLNGTLPSGISGINASATTTGPELANGTYTFRVTGGTSLADRTNVNYDILDASGGIAKSGTGVSFASGTNDLDNGITIASAAGFQIGQQVSFEYIKQGFVKYELNDSSNVAQVVDQDGVATGNTGTFGYYSAAVGTVNTGRGFTFTNAVIGSTNVGDKRSFNFLQAGNFVVDVSNAQTASNYMTTVNSALDTVNQSMADLGSLMARLTFKEDQVATDQVNVESSYSRIMNANMAEEQVNASKFAILQQTATAMLAQANQAPQNLLSLFR
jgi:flagellin